MDVINNLTLKQDQVEHHATKDNMIKTQNIESFIHKGKISKPSGNLSTVCVLVMTIKEDFNASSVTPPHIMWSLSFSLRFQRSKRSAPG